MKVLSGGRQDPRGSRSRAALLIRGRACNDAELTELAEPVTQETRRKIGECFGLQARDVEQMMWIFREGSHDRSVGRVPQDARDGWGGP
jgi:hypothetical protein